MDEKFIRDRITELRLQKDVPERKMSIELGHSTSYIHSIASGRALPSMPEFLYICDLSGCNANGILQRVRTHHANTAKGNPIYPPAG